MSSMQHDPHESGQRLARFAKNEQDEVFFAALNQILRQADLPNTAAAGVDDLPILYVVGAPRCGTTLLSQLLSRHLPVGYIDHIIARFWLRPSVGIRLSQAVFGEEKRNHISLQSKHGVTLNAWEPHEFGYFWRHWLKLDEWPTHHLSTEALAAVDKIGLKRVLEGEILATFQTPTLFKNTLCGFHAGLLAELHPKSLFIHISRDLYASAASILQTRLERYGSYETWWSFVPAAYPYPIPKNDPAAEVVQQVQDIRREIEAELSQSGIHAYRLTYEELCLDPHRVIEVVCSHLGELGYVIQPLALDYPALKASPGPSLPPQLETRLRECVTQTEDCVP